MAPEPRYYALDADITAREPVELRVPIFEAMNVSDPERCGSPATSRHSPPPIEVVAAALE